jgi:hypothetical protein
MPGDPPDYFARGGAGQRNGFLHLRLPLGNRDEWHQERRVQLKQDARGKQDVRQAEAAALRSPECAHRHQRWHEVEARQQGCRGA